MIDKLIKIILTAFLIISSDVYSQSRYTTDDLSNMIVCIADKQGVNVKISGTATIISDSLRFFVLTAAHVIDSLKGECFLVFRVDNDRPVSVPLQKFVGARPIKWINHSEADVSVLEITPFDENSRMRLKQSHFPIKQILSERQAIPREMNVVTMGFPLVDEIGQYFSPLTFNSYFSSGLITLRRADTKKQATFQLLEDPSVQGYSGGPVLIGLNRVGATYGPNQTVLVGIVHGTFFDNTGGKIAMITPAFYIQELFK